MKLFLISDNVDTQTGMRLAGVDGVVVHERQEFKEALEQTMSNPDVGIVLITEGFGKRFPDVISGKKVEYSKPLIVEIPDRHGTGRSPDFITAYVNEAIGLKL